MNNTMHELQSLRSLSPVSDDTRAHPRSLQDDAGSKNKIIVSNSEEIKSGASLGSRSWKKGWLPEFLAWCFAAVTLAILIIVLASFKDKPLRNWHSRISINTLINVLTMISSMTLMIPVKSAIAQLRWLRLRKKEQRVVSLEGFGRGPVDIFWMLSEHPKMLLAYLGTINVIFILLFSPITQETVAFPLRQHNLTTNTGSIAARTSYRVTNPPMRDIVRRVGQQYRDDDIGAHGYQSVDQRMSSAIQLAITGTPADLSSVQAACDSANCTFEPYSTLGVCARIDVVPHDEITQDCPYDYIDEDVKQYSCTYTVRQLEKHPPWQTLNLTTGGARSRRPPHSRPATNTLYVGSSNIKPNPLIDDPYVYTFPNPETLTEFYIVYVADGADYEDPAAEPSLYSSIGAYKVGLDLCAYQFNTTFMNGVTTTGQLSRSTGLTWIKVEKTLGKTVFTAVSTNAWGKEFWMEEETVRQFNQHLGLEVFQGASAAGRSQQVIGNAAPASDTPNTFGKLLVNKPSDEGLDGLRKTMDNLALGMTNAIRIATDEDSTVPGVPSEQVIYISVNFTWLIVPILSVVLALLFFLAVVIETARSGTPIWKASPAAALLSLDQDASSAIASQDHSKSMEERAKELTLRLKSRGDQGWFLESTK